jgi:pilus assembly protein CpaF
VLLADTDPGPGDQHPASVQCMLGQPFEHPDWVAMQTWQAGLECTGEVPLRELAKQVLRMRPSRIVGYR